MSGPDQLSILFCKRESIREHINALHDFLNQYDSNNPDHFIELKLRADTVASNFSELDKINHEIQVIDEANDHITEKKNYPRFILSSFCKGAGYYQLRLLFISSSRSKQREL